MVRRIAWVTLVGALLLGVPNAVGLELGAVGAAIATDVPEPVKVGGQDFGIPTDGPDEDLQDAADGAVETVRSTADDAGRLATEEVPRIVGQALAEAQDAIDGALGSDGCRSAVALTRTGYGGTVLDERDRRWAFTTQRVVPFDFVSRVVQGRNVQEAVGLVESASGRDVPLEETWQVVERMSDLTVQADWHEEYVDWEPVTVTVYVTLPLGLPELGVGQGTLVEVCDEQTPVYSTDEEAQAAGYDRWMSLAVLGPEDGWEVTEVTVRVTFSTLDQLEDLPALTTDEFHLAFDELVTAIEDEIARVRGFAEEWRTLPVPEPTDPGTPIAPAMEEGSPEDAAATPPPFGIVYEPVTTMDSQNLAPSQPPAPMTWAALALLGLALLVVGRRAWARWRGA